jgi:hypothetical protein
VTLDLQSLELPPPLLLEAALSGLRGLRQLTLHASMESILEVSQPATVTRAMHVTVRPGCLRPECDVATLSCSRGLLMLAL